MVKLGAAGQRLHDDKLEISQFPVIATGPLRQGDRVLGGLLDLFDSRPCMTVESADALAKLTENSDAIWMSSTLGAAEELSNGTLVKLERADLPEPHHFDVRIYSSNQRSPSLISSDISERIRRIFAAI